MLSEDIGVLVAELVEQPRRPLDIGEEERHRPGRELGSHLAILSRLAPLDYGLRFSKAAFAQRTVPRPVSDR